MRVVDKSVGEAVAGRLGSVSDMLDGVGSIDDVLEGAESIAGVLDGAESIPDVLGGAADVCVVLLAVVAVIPAPTLMSEIVFWSIPSLKYVV